MLKTSTLYTLAALSLSCGQALADADCSKAPADKWLPVYEMQKKIINDYKFSIKKFTTTGNCYEIYGWGLNATGTQWEKIEVYFDPVTGAIVKKVNGD
ncbi:MAG: PepSY domain-containing protein [Marinagarivorans sp.]